jgi:hypothetical protein
MSVNNIKPCGATNDIWDWKSGNSYVENTIGKGIIFERNYFDCGTYFFDGHFNVVKFPKDMTLYHGSFQLANAVVGFPVGIPYYDPATPNLPPVDTILAGSSNESIEELISTHVPITAGWYGNLNIARGYSIGNSENNPRKLCGDKCVFAYKLKKDIIMLLLDDDYNIAKIFQNTSLPEDLKIALEFMFDLTGKRNSFIISPDKLNTIIYPEKKRLSNYTYDGKFAELACTHIINKLNYSGYCANKQTANKTHVTHTGGGSRSGFHLEFIFCNVFKWLKRDLMNTNDWENQIAINNVDPLIKLYYDELDLYETTNINFHSGNLLEHSVWSLLWAEYILNKSGDFKRLIIADPIIKNQDNIKKVIVFTSFIHDIGKMSYKIDPTIVYNKSRKKFIYFDVKDHMTYGSNFIMSGNFPIYESDGNHTRDIDIDTLFSKFGIKLKYKLLIIMIIRLHWDFGNILKTFNTVLKETSNQVTALNAVHKIVDDYLNNIYMMMKPTDNLSFSVFVSSLIIVSISDNLATQPYGVDRIKTKNIIENSPVILSLNKKSSYFPFLTNMPKNYKGINLPVISNLYTTGINLSNEILKYSTTFYNTKSKISEPVSTPEEEMDIEM